MKTINFKLIFLLLFGLTLVITSCPSDDDNSKNSSTQKEIEAIVESGTWRITGFIDSGTDKTNYFTGYNFTFYNSGVLNANNGTNNYDGAWSISYSSSSSDEDSQDDLDFNINFNLTNDFEELNDDWDFILHTSTKIELIDVSDGNSETDYLTFEKN
tara:strand:- start:104 stop:574 length:471 start_codon:yes stop_codon:yes gene_type:complete